MMADISDDVVQSQSLYSKDWRKAQHEDIVKSGILAHLNEGALGPRTKNHA